MLYSVQEILPWMVDRSFTQQIGGSPLHFSGLDWDISKHLFPTRYYPKSLQSKCTIRDERHICSCIVDQLSAIVAETEMPGVLCVCLCLELAPTNPTALIKQTNMEEIQTEAKQ